MTKQGAIGFAKYEARGRSAWFDVVRTPRGSFDAFPRYADAQPRSDKGVVVATFNTYGERV